MHNNERAFAKCYDTQQAPIQIPYLCLEMLHEPVGCSRSRVFELIGVGREVAAGVELQRLVIKGRIVSGRVRRTESPLPISQTWSVFIRVIRKIRHKISRFRHNLCPNFVLYMFGKFNQGENKHYEIKTDYYQHSSGSVRVPIDGNIRSASSELRLYRSDHDF